MNIIHNLFDRFLKTGVYDKLHKIAFGDLEYRMYRLNQFLQEAADHHRKIFPQFKNKYAGREIVIVACGPTAAAYQPIPDAVHIAINRAIRMKEIEFDYLFAGDGGPGSRDFINELNAYPVEKCVKFYAKFPPRIADSGVGISESDVIKAKALRYYVEDFQELRGFNPDFAFDLANSAMARRETTVFQALQFALWTNPKRIYLVGCDCTSTGHFYNKTEQNTLTPSHLLEHYRDFKRFAETYYPDTEIISINPVGLKGMFKDLPM